MSTRPTAFLCDPLFLEHKTGLGHPEKPERLRSILDRLAAAGLLDQCLRPSPAPAPFEAIARLHDPDYIRRIEEWSNSGHMFREEADTAGSPATYRSACLAAGAVLAATDAVMAGEVRNAFCAVRPPGHHAMRDYGMGFCFFNNIAIGARHLQERWKLPRIAIIDWDVHHGNGTQAAFYDDPSVFFFSIHQFPLYPGSGRRDEQGQDAGRGFTMNRPVAIGSTDTDYLRIFREELGPALRGFKPDFLLVSAGFDAAVGDPLGGIQITAEGYAGLTREVCGWARDLCAGRVVSVLEGGYNTAELAECVEAHLRALMAG